MPAGVRSRKFNQATLNKLFQGIRLGMTYEHAAKYAGITDETLRNWRNGNFPEYVTDEEREAFLEEFDTAEGEAVAAKMGTILTHSQDDWKAAAWMLERRYPDSYGRVIQKVEHANANDQPFMTQVSAPAIEAALERLPLDKLEALADIAKHLQDGIADGEIIDVEPVERKQLEATHGHEDHIDG